MLRKYFSRMRRGRLFLMALIIILVMIIGYLVIQSLILQDSLTYNWLRGIPCHIPCWEGIEPGKTTQLDAEKIIRSISYYDDINEGSFIRNYNNMDWNKSHSIAFLLSNNLVWGGTITYDKQTNIVLEINVQFPNTITVGELINVFGQPSHIVALASHNIEYINKIDQSVELYWMNLGLGIFPQEKNRGSITMIDPDLVIIDARYFNTDQDSIDEILNLSYPNSKPFLQTWRGYANFEDYCFQIDNSHNEKWDLKKLCKMN